MWVALHGGKQFSPYFTTVAANNNPGPIWYPPVEPSDQPQTTNWKRLFTEYVWQLRSQQSNLNQTVQNVNQNLTQQITKIIEAANNNAAANNNNATTKPPVIFGYSGIMWLNYPPNLWTGYLFVQTDRNAVYYSNGSAWLALEGTGTGSFENRWANLNSFDAGLYWIETSRNNFNGSTPYPTYEWNGNNWNYLSGEFYRNQSNLAQLTATFSANNSNNGNDTGARVNIPDYAGQLQWANNAWGWGPDDSRMHGMGPMLAEVDPNPTTGWALYDGNNATYLKPDGTTGAVTLPNLVAGFNNNANLAIFLAAGGNDSNINLPVRPVLATIGSNNFTINPIGTPALTGPFLDANNNTVANANAISNNGTPPNLVRRPWFRM